MPDSQTELDRQRLITTIDQRSSAGWRVMLIAVAAAALAVALFVRITALTRTKITVPREAFSVLTQRSWAVLGFAVAIGVASAALIQLAKQLFGVRSRFQRRWVTAWIEERCAIEPLWADWWEQHEKLPYVPASTPVSSAVLTTSQRTLAAAELETVLLGGFADQDLRQVFDLPIEQLCAQIGSAADFAISKPDEYAELLLALMGPAGLKSIDDLAPPRDIAEGRIRRGLNKDGDAYALVAQTVRQGIDLMQISLGQRWRRGVRRTAVLISGMLGFAGVLFVQITWPTRVLFALAALVLGGFFAWLVRDMAAIVERVRR